MRLNSGPIPHDLKGCQVLISARVHELAFVDSDFPFSTSGSISDINAEDWFLTEYKVKTYFLKNLLSDCLSYSY